MSTPTRFAGGWQIKVLPLARYIVKWFYPFSKLDFSDPKVQANALQQARLRNPDVTIDFSNPKVIAHMKKFVRLPIAAIDELIRLTNEGRKYLPLVRSPLLIIQSKHDQTVNPACAEELFRLTVAAEPKSLHWLERADHVVTIGSEQEEVFRLCLAFINATAPGAARTSQPGGVLQDEEDGNSPDH